MEGSGDWKTISRRNYSPVSNCRADDEHAGARACVAFAFDVETVSGELLSNNIAAASRIKLK
jgi:hypothetical protein